MLPTFPTRILRALALAFLALCAWTGGPALQPAHAEYGDVVINNYSDASGMRPVVFPHWFHRIRYRCKVCHADLGFKFKAGGNEINMVKIIDGQFCGACHNGDVAWSVENCNMCHSAKPNTPTQVHESTVHALVLKGGASAPAAAPPAAAAAPAPAPAAPAKK
jgi:c(7)-type cytochrome triheme protein